MKNKILNIVIFIGILAIAAAIALALNGLLEPTSLAVQYTVLGGLLITFIGLNLRFRKRTDYEEAIVLMRRSRRAVGRIQPNKEVRFVQLRTIKNQLTNAKIYLNDTVAKYDLYNLQTLAEKLDDVKNHYNLDDDFKSTFSSNDLKEDLRIIDQIIKELEMLKK